VRTLIVSLLFVLFVAGSLRAQTRDDVPVMFYCVGSGFTIGLYRADRPVQASYFLAAEIATGLLITNSFRHDSRDDLKFEFPLIIAIKIGEILTLRNSTANQDRSSFQIEPRLNNEGIGLAFRVGL
jgi:hypothetical protein